MASFNVQSLKPDIESILALSDRSSVSAKAVRKSLQAKYPELDVKAHKAEIDALTTAVFTAEASGEDDAEDVKPTVTSPKPKLPSFTKVKRARSPSSTADYLSDGVLASSPAFALASTSAPRTKPAKPELTDEELARQLQGEFEAQARGRSTRNGGTTATTKKRATGKKSKRGGSDDEGVKKKKRKTSYTGFNKLHVLSNELAEICEAPALGRPGITKALWKYIKANGLQDPAKKTDILPDEKLKLVLPFNRINSFTMAKHIGPHLYPFDPVEHAHLVPPAESDISDPGSDGEDGRDSKRKIKTGTPSSSAGVTKANGRTKSAAEVDSADDED